MRVCVDTNVLVSATFWKGDSQKIIKLAESKNILLFLSKNILEEYKSVLNYEEIQDKIRDKHLEIHYSLRKIISISKIVEPKQKFDIVKDDPDDNIVIDCAVEGNCDFIITQDKHLLKIRKFRNIKMITPKEFLQL